MSINKSNRHNYMTKAMFCHLRRVSDNYKQGCSKNDYGLMGYKVFFYVFIICSSCQIALVIIGMNVVTHNTLEVVCSNFNRHNGGDIDQIGWLFMAKCQR